MVGNLLCSHHAQPTSESPEQPQPGCFLGLMQATDAVQSMPAALRVLQSAAKQTAAWFILVQTLHCVRSMGRVRADDRDLTWVGGQMAWAAARHADHAHWLRHLQNRH